jgi:hypothetical protein
MAGFIDTVGYAMQQTAIKWNSSYEHWCPLLIIDKVIS